MKREELMFENKMKNRLVKKYYISHENKHTSRNRGTSKYLLNDGIAGQNDPIYKLLPSSVNSKVQAKQQTKF